MTSINDLKIKLYADGADVDEMKKMYKRDIVHGFTTNPTLMRQAGVKNYEEFARKVLAEITDLMISFEVCLRTISMRWSEKQKRSQAGAIIFMLRSPLRTHRENHPFRSSGSSRRTD